jgi:hypothetical protein
VASEQVETVGDGVDEPVGYLDAATFSGDVQPNVVELSFSLWCQAMSHVAFPD